MNGRMITSVLGKVLLVEALLLLFPLGVAILYSEDLTPFIITILACGIVGFILNRFQADDTTVYAKDGLAIVALSWIILSIFGALPFFIGGMSSNFIDCVFETVSGFTTTGSSILTDIEAVDKGLLFWRSFTHWIGGMGVLVFVLAIIPLSDGHGMHLMRAEVPGPTVGKLVSKMSTSAKILYEIYAAMTVIEIILLMLGGMPLYDACINSFGTAGTGGFCHLAASIGAYNNTYYDIVIGIFMLLFGINFNLYYFVLIGQAKEFFRSEELRVYLGIVFASTIVIAINIANMYTNFAQSLRYSFFQVASIITTTGYATYDFNTWPTLSKTILVTLMFIGACAGSTGGGMKISRLAIAFKASISEMSSMVHPNAVPTVRFEGKPVSEKVTKGIRVYLIIYAFILVFSTLIVSIDGFDYATSFTAVVATFNNIGPGLNLVGPTGSFYMFSNLSKIVLILDMLLGRLEIYPLLLMFAPSAWKRRKSVK